MAAMAGIVHLKCLIFAPAQAEVVSDNITKSIPTERDLFVK